MFNVALPSFLFTLCILAGRVEVEIFERDFSAIDVFRATRLDTYQLRRGLEMQKLNDLLTGLTDSDDPDKNLNLLLEKLESEERNQEVYLANGQSLRAKRLLLALRTLKREKICSYYAIVILSANLRAAGTSVEFFAENKDLKRVDRILAHFIRQHLERCKGVYLRNYDEISKSLDGAAMRRLEILLKKPIQVLTSDEFPGNEGKTYIERIYNLIMKKGILYQDKGVQIYDAMEELIKDEPDERFVEPIEDEQFGIARIREDKFKSLHEEYVLKPCKYLRETLGPKVFEPYLFYNMFEPEMHNDRVDFYETCLKYRLCYSGLFGGSYRSALSYGDSLVERQQKGFDRGPKSSSVPTYN